MERLIVQYVPYAICIAERFFKKLPQPFPIFLSGMECRVSLFFITSWCAFTVSLSLAGWHSKKERPSGSAKHRLGDVPVNIRVYSMWGGVNAGWRGTVLERCWWWDCAVRVTVALTGNRVVGFPFFFV